MRRFAPILCLFLSTWLQAAQKPSQKCPETPTLGPGGVTVWIDCHGKPVPTPQPMTSPSPVQPAQNDISAPATIPSDPAATKAYYEAVTAHYEFDKNAYVHATRVFEWQHTSSVIAFWMVILLVLAGLTLAAIQFRIAMKAHDAHMQLTPAVMAAQNATQTSQASTEPEAQQAAVKEADCKEVIDKETESKEANVTTFEASLKGIKISSSVIGLIVLAISMAFFYLYLKFIYPIQNLSSN